MSVFLHATSSLMHWIENLEEKDGYCLFFEARIYFLESTLLLKWLWITKMHNGGANVVSLHVGAGDLLECFGVYIAI